MIEKKKKICKGTYKTGHFKGCGKLTYPYKFGLCRTCFVDWCFNDKLGQEYYSKQFTPAAKKHKESIDKREKVNYAGKLQLKVQEIARLIDIGHECVATGKMATSYDGGHVNGKGAHPECKYNLHNIFAQSSESNRSTQDDILMSEGVNNIFGKEYHSFVLSLANRELVKHSKVELAQMYARACKESNKLRKEGKKHTLIERIELRNEINNKIGYYPNDLCEFKIK